MEQRQDTSAAFAAASASAQALTWLLAGDSTSLFQEGWFARPASSSMQQQVPWSAVRDIMEMAGDALQAKQRAAERLAREVATLRAASGSSSLLQRAQRAEVDSGCLLDELEQLMQAKASVAEERADLGRANALLMAERQLVCEQLQVPPDGTVNLNTAVSKVLAAARRSRALDGQLRLLAKFQRELLLQLEAAREEAGRAARQWQAREAAYQQVLAGHGIPVPEQLKGAAGDAAAADAAAAAAGAERSSSSSSNVAVLTQLMLMRRLSSGAAAAEEGVDILGVGSPAHHAHMLPPTPPVHDSMPAPPPVRDSMPAPQLGATPPPVPCCVSRPMRRSHSLDSALNSLTGLLDQLALGQIGLASEDEAFDDLCEADSSEADGGWLPADVMSGDSSCSKGVQVAAAAAALHHHQQHHHHLQPVQEAGEDAAAA